MSASTLLRPTRRITLQLRQCCSAAALCLLASSGPAAFAAGGPMDFVLLGQPKVAGQATQMSWRMGEYSALRLVDAEPGAGSNEHPQELLAERLKAALGAITIGPGNETLFDRDEADQLAVTLQQVLKAARPEHDVLLMSSARRGRGLLAPQLTVTARLFVRDGHLHLLVHDDRLDVITAYRQTRMLPSLAFGSRTTRAAATQLRIDGRAGPRPDWLSWPLAALRPGAPVSATPVDAEAVAASGSAAPTQAGARSVEERLRLLKHLHEQGLISDDDYARKRSQILTEL